MKNPIIVFFAMTVLASCSTKKEPVQPQNGNGIELTNVSEFDSRACADLFQVVLDDMCRIHAGRNDTVGKDVNYQFTVRNGSDTIILSFFKCPIGMTVDIQSSDYHNMSSFVSGNNYQGGYYYNTAEKTKGKKLLDFYSDVKKLANLYEKQNH
ncbi:MAG: hypothetical protein JWM20_393 [Patescibacteria group bacterium]|nr:hypothetical protein [Patescibacteria group bacterium]